MATSKEVVDTMSTAVLLNIASRCHRHAVHISVRRFPSATTEEQEESRELLRFAERLEILADVKSGTD